MPANYLTADEVAGIARCSTKSVFLALRGGPLHGSQRVKGGTWLIREQCAEAWIEGRKCEHQSQNVTPIRRRA